MPCCLDRNVTEALSLLHLTESSEMSNVLEVSAQQISCIDLSAGLAYSSHRRKMADYHTIGIGSSKLLCEFAWTFNIDLFILYRVLVFF